MTAGDDAAREPQAAMVLSAEQVAVGTEWVVTGQARLRRRIVAETRSIEIVVRREVLEIETVDTNTLENGQVLVGTAYDGPAVYGVGPIPDVVILLREEVPEITLRTQPYERVTARITLTSSDVPVSTPVRHEDVVLETAPAGSPAVSPPEDHR